MNFNFLEQVTGIAQTGTSLQVQRYPNPAKDEVNINLPGFGNLLGLGVLKASLISADGKVVNTFTINSSLTQLNVGNLQAGIYILKIENTENVLIKRLVIR